LKEKIDPVNRHIRIPPAKRYYFLGKGIKDDGSLPYTKEYLNTDPRYVRDMKVQDAEMALLGVAHSVTQVLDYPESKLHETVTELRQDASSILLSLASHLREPNLDAPAMLAEASAGIIALAAKAIEAGENPENEIDFSVQNAKEKVAVLLEYYARQLQEGDGLKKLLTHPALAGFAKATLEAVGSSV
jgi:hypothetical protein